MRMYRPTGKPDSRAQNSSEGRISWRWVSLWPGSTPASRATSIASWRIGLQEGYYGLS